MAKLTRDSISHMVVEAESRQALRKELGLASGDAKLVLDTDPGVIDLITELTSRND
jgi:hypothetical protein